MLPNRPNSTRFDCPLSQYIPHGLTATVTQGGTWLLHLAAPWKCKEVASATLDGALGGLNLFSSSMLT